MIPGRRRFATGLGALVLASGRAGADNRRDGRVKTLGYLSRGAGPQLLAKLLAERGHVEGRSLRIEVRVARGEDPEIQAAARELVLARPDVLVGWGAQNVTALARETRTIPIVCGGTADPVGLGFAKSLRHPGGNITGLSYGVPEMSRIMVGLIQDVLPALRRLAVFVDEQRGAVDAWTPVIRSLQEAAKEKAIAWEIVPFASLSDFENKLSPLDPRSSAAFIQWIPDSVKPGDLAALLVRMRRVSFATSSDFVRLGMLMHYSLQHADEMRAVAAIVDAMLRGANPASYPFQLPDRTEFVLNRATARAIGIELQAGLLARATEIVG